MDKIPFAFSIHPGEILLTEFMEPLGLTAYRLAKELHISAPRVNDLVRGKRGITADTALRLAATSATPRNSGLACRAATTSGSPPGTRRSTESSPASKPPEPAVPPPPDRPHPAPAVVN